MKKFAEYIEEAATESSLSVFDIDDTLFSTDTKVHVTKGGKRVYSLSPAEFNVYKLKRGEEYDFSDFRSSSVFAKTAKPIQTVFKTAKKMLSRFSGNQNKKIIVVTARADLDDRDLFLSTFKKYGFDTNRVHVFRAGNINSPGAEAKKTIIKTQLNAGKYTIARMFDDAKANLDKSLELSSDFPDTRFETFMILRDGRIKRYK